MFNVITKRFPIIMGKNWPRNGSSFMNCRENKLLKKIQYIQKYNCRTTYTKLPNTPDLIYYPRVTRWLANKVRFKILRKLWDPDFSEGAFIYGSTRAICKITEIIHMNEQEALDDLVTMSVKIKLVDDMNTNLTKLQKSIIQLQPNDIKMLIPNKVKMKRDGLKKICSVGMRVVALKWHMEKMGPLNLALIALQTEFTRDYSDGIEPNWTISIFDILECTLLAETRRR